MFEIIYIKHEKITQEQLDEVIKIKSVAWPFSYEKQLEWIRKNIKDSDIHVLLLKDKAVVAYLNLVNIELIVDTIRHSAYGIGNVCAIEKGKDLGKELIIRVNSYLKTMNRIGLLFCKPSLLNFYKKNYWNLVSNEKFKNKNSVIEVNILVYNFNIEYYFIEYNGELF